MVRRAADAQGGIGDVVAQVTALRPAGEEKDFTQTKKSMLALANVGPNSVTQTMGCRDGSV